MAYLLFKMDLPSSPTSTFLRGTLQAIDNGTPVKTWTATSGLRRYQSLSHQGTRNHGPIPCCSKVGISNYFVRTNSYWGSLAKSQFYYITPDPVSVPPDRGTFGIHFDAGVPGSVGCIVMNRSEFNSFEEFMKDYRKQGHSSIDLKVQYNDDEPDEPIEKVFTVKKPNSGRVNVPITFSGTAKSKVSTIKAFVGPGGPFKIADLKKVGETWSFSYTFLNSGNNRPFSFHAYDSSGNLLQKIHFNLTIKK